MILPTDHMARVERVVKQSIREDARVTVVIDDGFLTERPTYWERRFWVAWTYEKESGTHRVHIDSEERGAMFDGHYQMTEQDAKFDAFERAGMYVGRI